MIKRDFILRLIDKAAVFIAKAAGFRIDNQLEQSQATLQEAFKSLLGLEAKLVIAMDVPSLISLLGAAGEDDPGKLIAAAQLLEEQAEQDGDEHLRLNALHLYLFVHLLPGKADYLDRTMDIHRLLKKLENDLPQEINELLRQFDAALSRHS